MFQITINQLNTAEFFIIIIYEFHFGAASGREITHLSFKENQVKALKYNVTVE